MDQLPSVYVLDPYHLDAVEALRRERGIRLVLPPDARKDEALDRATAILLRSDTRVTAEDIGKAGSSLKFICKQGVGYDNVDVAAAKARKIGVYNTPGINSESVAELTIALALCIARRITEFDCKIRSGEKVVRSQMLGKSLFRKTLGIIGMGAIGREVAKKWTSAMNGTVIGFDPIAAEGAWTDIFDATTFTRATSLTDLVRTADVISLHVPLTEHTRNMISEQEFAIMKEDAILLNCARGGIVDETALLQALDSGKLYGAGLDAMVYEPPTLRDYGQTLLTHPRVVMTPHIGASTDDMQSLTGRRAVEIMMDLVHGRGDHKSVA
jgi:D-3-phosphoglycerate dehydrogenase / 2-oxoglutarate reductase